MFLVVENEPSRGIDIIRNIDTYKATRVTLVERVSWIGMIHPVVMLIRTQRSPLWT